MEEKKVRWRYYIDKPFQNRFMLQFSLVILLVLVVTLGMLWVIRENPFAKGLLPAPVLISQSPDKVFVCKGAPLSPASLPTLKAGEFTLPMPGGSYNTFQLWWKPILLVGTVNLLLIVVFGLFYSHSMAGPIHNIKVSMAELVSGGDPRPIRVRKGDQFQDLAELLNELVEKRVK